MINIKSSKNSIPITFSLLPKKKIFLFLFLFFINALHIYSQNTQIFHIPDSLKNKTYKELFNGLNSNFNNRAKEKIYVTAYLHKAKNENDTIRIANAYSQQASINDIQIAIKYCDSIINLTKNLHYFEYPGFGHMLKGIFCFELGRYNEALNCYITANNYFIKSKNLKYQFHINNDIGKLKNLWGNYSEALEIFKSQLGLLNQDKIELVNPKRLYLSVLFNLTNSYLLTKKLDSAFMYSIKGIQESLSVKDTTLYYEFVGQTGIVAYYQNNFKMALDSLNKALPFESNSNGFLNHHYYRGQIYHKQKKDAQAFYHFKKADSIYNATNDIVPEVRKIQEFFVNYYKKHHDIENQLIYIDRLLYVDSIMTNNYKKLNEILVKKYDTPLLLSEKEKIITHLKEKEKKSSFVIFSLITLVLIIIAFFLWLYRKQRILKERFNKHLLNVKKETFNKKLLKKKTIEFNGISKEIVKLILEKLEEFETSNTFLDNKLTLNNLSKTFNTNSNYLSKIINSYKEKNFSTYISDLRIDYCLEKLKTDATFRKFTINAIAFEIGFNNVESFSKSFYKKTTIYPSNFIKEIEKT